MKTINLTNKFAAIAHLRSLPASTTITIPSRHDAAPHSPEADAIGVVAGVPCYEFAANHNQWEWSIESLLTTLTTQYGNPSSAASFEIVFDNGGGATLQNHNGTVAIHYTDMTQLAHDARLILDGDNASGWDGIDPEIYITDEQYEKDQTGGLFALQLDPEYRHNWPDADDTGWNNVAAFIRAFPDGPIAERPTDREAPPRPSNRNPHNPMAIKHITIYHVLTSKTGEQRFEDQDAEAAKKRATEFAMAAAEDDGPVIIWRTFDLQEPS